MWKWILIVVVLALALGGVVLFRSESARLQDKDWRLAAIGAGIVAHQVDMYRQANGELPRSSASSRRPSQAGRPAGRPLRRQIWSIPGAARIATSVREGCSRSSPRAGTVGPVARGRIATSGSGTGIPSRRS
jgi:hypothetical protein